MVYIFVFSPIFFRYVFFTIYLFIICNFLLFLNLFQVFFASIAGRLMCLTNTDSNESNQVNF